VEAGEDLVAEECGECVAVQRCPGEEHGVHDPAGDDQAECADDEEEDTFAVVLIVDVGEQVRPFLFESVLEVEDQCDADDEDGERCEHEQAGVWCGSG